MRSEILYFASNKPLTTSLAAVLLKICQFSLFWSSRPIVKTMTSLLERQTLLDFEKISAHQFFHPNAPFCQVIAKLHKVGYFFGVPYCTVILNLYVSTFCVFVAYSFFCAILFSYVIMIGYCWRSEIKVVID